MNDIRTLNRKSSNAVLGGVCAGMGEYFRVDPIIFRIIFIVLSIKFGLGLLLYVVLWIALPEEPPYNFRNTEEDFTTEDSDQPKDNYEFNQSATMENQENYDPNDPYYKRKNKGNLTGGLILIAIGILFLISNLVPHISFGWIIRTWWPLILVVVGAVMLGNHYREKRNY